VHGAVVPGEVELDKLMVGVGRLAASSVPVMSMPTSSRVSRMAQAA
jgi:hypothetical protein